MNSVSKAAPAQVLPIACLMLLVVMLPSAYAASPSAPTQLRVAAYSDTTSEVHWDRSTDDTLVIGYELTFNQRVLGIRDRLSFTFNGLIPGEQYEFSVTAVDTDGNRSRTSLFRVPAGVTTVLSPVPSVDSINDPVAAPTGFRSVVYSHQDLEVFWDRVQDSVMNYIVYLDGDRRDTTDGTSFYINGLQGGREYKVDVIAVASDGRESEPVSLTATTLSSDSPPAALPVEANPVTDAQPPIEVNLPVEEPPQIAAGGDILLNRLVYQQNGYATSNVIRVDLRTATTPGTCTATDLSGCTLADVIADIDKKDDLTVDIPVHFQSDDFADDGTISNATLRQRGGGARNADQKSFRIKLDSKVDLWRNERFLQLNKHPYDNSRMRNKLAMDLMSRVPHLPSFRTQFVNLWIDDGQGPVDYGLFTHVERANDDYLDRRDLDKKGNLYKATTFRFLRSDLDVIRVDGNGKPLDKTLFESVLDIEEGKDHRALVNMLTALHDDDRSFADVLDQYFNRNNVMAWMATNLLLRQNDATRHNYLLYNPSNTETFYFLPWDYDATLSAWKLPPDNSFGEDDIRNRIEYGYALGAENFFVEQFYKLPGMHAQLVQAARSIRRSYLDDATISRLSMKNAQLIEPFQNVSPDEEFNPYYNPVPTFAQNISDNERTIREDFSVPIPPTLSEPARQGESWKFSWEPATDITGHDISYDLQIAGSVAFDPIIEQVTGIGGSSSSWLINVANLPDSDFYVRLIARSSRNPSRFWVPARNRVIEDGTRYYGMIKVESN